MHSAVDELRLSTLWFPCSRTQLAASSCTCPQQHRWCSQMPPKEKLACKRQKLLTPNSSLELFCQLVHVQLQLHDPSQNAQQCTWSAPPFDVGHAERYHQVTCKNQTMVKLSLGLGFLLRPWGSSFGQGLKSDSSICCSGFMIAILSTPGSTSLLVRNLGKHVEKKRDVEIKNI